VVLVFSAVVFAPKVAVKTARLRGPQLPKTGEEMSFDIEPEQAEMVRARTHDADTYLSIVMVAGAVVLPVLFVVVMRTPGWVGWTLVALVSAALLLRSRTFLGVWQRVALVAAGIAGTTMVIMRCSAAASPGWRVVLTCALLVTVLPLVLAAVRPWPRRMLPVWEYTATFLDVVTALAVLPVLAQVLGVYARARGLFG
jgi:type VII secretion integral membrane protein EccD